MKLKQYLNYFAVFLLSAIAGALYFSPKHIVNPNQKLTLPGYIAITLNEQKFLTKISEVPEFDGLVENILKQSDVKFKNRISPVYASHDSNYLMSFFETESATSGIKDIHFVILRKQIGEFKISSTLKVTDLDAESIQFAFGDIQFLDREQFNLKTLKLAETMQLEDNL